MDLFVTIDQAELMANLIQCSQLFDHVAHQVRAWIGAELLVDTVSGEVLEQRKCHVKLLGRVQANQFRCREPRQR
jgi:hypothetical protein